MYYYATYRAPIGWCGVIASQAALYRVVLGEPGRKDLLAAVLRQFPDARFDAAVCGSAVAFLSGYFERGSGSRPPGALDFASASAFQRRVWDLTALIPFGQVRSYGWLAAQLGCPRAARAVGTALGRNPLPIIIPCHRVVRSSGHPGGFSAAGGSILKRRLLEHEGVVFDMHGRVIV